MAENVKELTRLLKESAVKITRLNNESKEESKVKADYEARLLATMDAIGTTTLKNEWGNFRKSVNTLPVAKDWEAIYEYVKENDAFYLLFKRLSSTAYKEMLEAGEVLPGAESYEKETISITKPT